MLMFLRLIGWHSDTKFDISKLLIGILILIAAVLLYSGFNTIMGKLGFETVASMRVKLDTANATVSKLQASNDALIKQAAEEADRHKKELAALADTINKQKEITTKLEIAKKKIAAQNANLKKALAASQEEAYTLYNVPKDKYYIYSKEIVTSLANNNYDILNSFLVSPVNETPKIVQDKRNMFQRLFNKSQSMESITNPPLLLTPKLQQ